MRLISVLILLTLLSSPALSEPVTIPYGMMQGDSLTVRLPSNPTTGFNWEIAQLPKLLEQIGEQEFVPKTKGTGMVGVGGINIWKFQVKSFGDGVLGFIYRRPWETVPPIDVVEYKLTALP